MSAFKYAIVITGGIGTGKSSVSTILRLYGYTIIDADKIAHQVLEENSALVKELFSQDILDKDLKIDRKKLAQIIFSNEKDRRKLEHFLHPKIRQEILNQASDLEIYKQYYFLDIPLFFEVGGRETYEVDKVLLIYAPREMQIQRIVTRDGISEEEAIKRIDAQMDIEKKKLQSENIIKNTRGLKYLQEEVENFLKTL
ncbi:dephospho-CoA kinase [Helicobacter cappadocius]|uniref:Dephospho-CoA kinase n=1 Tax=Helicobacter cappadocius TaxID=3063998 RepID=A0AA90PPS6_9HELI|nr:MULTISPECIES: dephospho-CoA kinase [unclassified Helicobacter]MDO7252584.1 dephospho-CoA kinase [Helicobacter sp. faydin-H75]MDP2538451.1 dephospho-CoA kinase [Helicobacter sp. faydin-H76]